MKFLLILLQFTILSNCFCQDWQYPDSLYAPTVHNPAEKAGWNLVFNDEFNTGSLNTDFWDPILNGCNENCLSWVDGGNFEFTNETIKLKCVKVDDYRTDPYLNYGPLFYDYTGGWLKSQQPYGAGHYFETRVKRNSVGSKSSFWYAFHDEEGKYHDIDVFDNGFENQNAMKFFHVDFGKGDIATRRSFDINYNSIMPKQDEEYYTYAIDWQEDYIKIYVNNTLVATHTSYQIHPGFINFWCMPMHWIDSSERKEGVLEIDYFRIYKKNCDVETAVVNYGLEQGYINQNERPRFLADVNNDGRKDVVAFAWNFTLVSLANTDGTFDSSPDYIFQNFTKEQSYLNQNNNPRFLVDINNDNKADIIGVKNGALYGSISNYSNNFAQFHPVSYVPFSAALLNNSYVDQNLTPILNGDFNGDGKNDFISFGSTTRVSLSNTSTSSTTPNFKSPVSITGYNQSNNWPNQSITPRYIVDVNGDGRDDIVGFGLTGTYVSLSTSSSSTPSFLPPQLIFNEFSVAQGWTNQEERPRLFGDVNGDGKKDIIGFGYNGTFVSLSSSITTYAQFNSPQWVQTNFTKEQGWDSLTNYPRIVADINGDHKADIIGFGDGETKIAISKSSLTNASFDEYQNVIADFTREQGWTNTNSFPRYIEDINGDSINDLVGFGYNKVYSLVCLSPEETPLPTRVAYNETSAFENDFTSSKIKEVNVFPNPSSGQINISLFDDSYSSIEVYDNLGRLVFNDEITTSNYVLNLDYSGIYTLRITGVTKSLTERIIVE